MKNRLSLKDWIIAMRPWSFPAASMPALVTFTYVFFISQHHGLQDINWFHGVLALIGAIIFQASGNLISDYFDYQNGVDREDTLGSSRLLVDKTFNPKTILSYGIAALVVGALLGLYLCYHTGWPLLIIGVLGSIGTACYYYFKSKALGDLLIFLIFGPLISLGVFYVMTDTLSWHVIALSLPLSCITVNILHANNTRDIMHDKRANIKTVAMLLGVKASIFEYKLLIFLTYLLMIVLVATGTLHWATLLVFVTLPLALKNCKKMGKARENRPEMIGDLDVQTAQLQLMFSVLLSGLIFISAWL